MLHEKDLEDDGKLKQQAQHDHQADQVRYFYSARMSGGR
jgi:hypothetical protein